MPSLTAVHQCSAFADLWPCHTLTGVGSRIKGTCAKHEDPRAHVDFGTPAFCGNECWIVLRKEQVSPIRRSRVPNLIPAHEYTRVLDQRVCHILQGRRLEANRIHFSWRWLHPSTDIGLTTGSDLLKTGCSLEPSRFSAARSKQRLCRIRLHRIAIQPPLPKGISDCIHRSICFAETST